eukprot:scaffold3003_cov279-Pinguiococcus_pyrenoidosus.AAC.5
MEGKARVTPRELGHDLPVGDLHVPAVAPNLLHSCRGHLTAAQKPRRGASEAGRASHTLKVTPPDRLGAITEWNLLVEYYHMSTMGEASPPMMDIEPNAASQAQQVLKRAPNTAIEADQADLDEGWQT